MPKPFAHVVQLVIVGELHGQETNNVMHFGVNSLEFNWAALFADVIDCLMSTFRPAASDEWVLKMLVGRTLFPQLGDPVEYIHNVTVAGTGLPGSPSFCANLIQIKTGFGGRRNRGRIFLPGVIENDVTASRLTDSGLAKLVAFAACMAGKFIRQGELAAPTFEIGVLSRTTAKEAGQTIETAFKEARSLVAQRVVARMGSRKVGVGS